MSIRGQWSIPGDAIRLSDLRTRPLIVPCSERSHPALYQWIQGQFAAAGFRPRIAAIEAADSRHRYRWLLEPHTIRTLLLLLYGTGLRISEALRLTLADFDTDTGVLTVRETKFFKSRFVPVGNDLRGVLCRYIDRQWPQSLRSETTPLLGTVKGASITRQTAELVFKRLREQAGVSRSDDATFQPRLHDFRHTFAVVRLVTWYREGKNVQRLLPHLSIYLGHGVLRDTQRYLSMTTDLLQQASLCFERYARPEVPHV